MADEVEKKDEEVKQPDETTDESPVEETASKDSAQEDTPEEEAPESDDEESAESEDEETSTEEEAPKETLKKKKVAKIDKVAAFSKQYLRDDIPEFKAGDTLRVHYKIVEGGKTRVQAYEGVCIARKHGGINETIKVRKMSSSQIGVERTFFLHSRLIEKIEVKKIGKVRRAKIYYLRGRVGKAARIREAGIH